MSKLRALFELFKEAFKEWNEDRAPRLAASLAYYTTFSIAPLIIVVIAIGGLALGQDAVQGRLDEQIQGLIGREGADFIQEVVKNSNKPSESILSTVVGLVTLLLGAAGVFGQLKDALNTAWDVPPQPGNGILNMLKTQFVSFGMVLGIGFLLMVSLVISAVLSAMGNFVNGLLPEAEFVSQLINFVISFVIIMVLFAMLYKFLPDIEIQWRDVLVGAALTSLLFTIGKQLLGLYLGNSGIASPYGAAGSLVIMLVWIYYSAQIFLFGAEFTQVYARRYGSHAPDGNNEFSDLMNAGLKSATQPALTPTELAEKNLTHADELLPVENPKPRPGIATLLGLGTVVVSFIMLMGSGGKKEKS